MSLVVTSAAYQFMPVAPVARVRAVATPAPAAPRPQPTIVASSPETPVARPHDAFRRQHAAVLADLRDDAPVLSGSDRWRDLDRAQLAAMAYDRSTPQSHADRDGARAQLETNDRDFLDRARELAQVSGDERVLVNARIALDAARTATEGAALSGADDAPDVAALRRDVAARTAEFGGAPVAIALHYPNGFAAPSATADGGASPGAARVAKMYRDDDLF